ncbi:MAG: hypothetical protein ACLRU1_07870 [Veillonella parvula]
MINVYIRKAYLGVHGRYNMFRAGDVYGYRGFIGRGDSQLVVS